MKKIIVSILLAVLVLTSAVSCKTSDKTSADEIEFVDSSGRKVMIPKEITRIAPSGAVTTMFLASIAPEYMVSVNATPSSTQYKYLPDELVTLPTTGQMYGSKSTLNLEALLIAKPQLIIDLGDKKTDIDKDMDGLQKQVGIPVIFIEANLENMAAAYRTLGRILFGKAERGEAIAAKIDETLSMAHTNAAKIPEDARRSVAFLTGTSGLDSNASGSTQAQVIPIIGAINAIVVDDVSDRGGGNTINLEQLKNFDPEVIIFSQGSVYSTAASDPAWQLLTAIQTGKYYEIPALPYNWMANPPSVNMVFGIWWLGNLLYPDVYDYDIVKETRELFRLLWGYDLTETEAREILGNGH